MLSRRSIGKLAISAIAISITTLLPAIARADSYSQQFDYGPLSTNWATSFVFNKFDTSLGTLTGVTYELYGETTVGFQLDNDGSTPDFFIPSAKATLTLDSVPGVSGGIIQVVPIGSQTYNLAADDGDGPLAIYTGPDSLISSITATDTTTGSATPLSLYEGPGTINLNLSANGRAVVDAPGNSQNTFTQTARGLVKLTYTYATPLPEPGTIALALPALVGLVTLARRRKNH